jgi:hypothetical protein
VPDGLDNTLEGLRHIGEVGNTATDDEHLRSKQDLVSNVKVQPE